MTSFSHKLHDHLFLFTPILQFLLLYIYVHVYLQKPTFSSLFTLIYSLNEHACFTHHLTAPFEPTVAVLNDLHLLLFETLSTTHNITSPYTFGERVTLSSIRSYRAVPPIRFAKVRGFFSIDKILHGVRFKSWYHRYKTCTVICTSHFDRCIKTVLKSLTHMVKHWHLLPARF